MSTFHDQMAQINLLQGKEPIDGTRIEGFGAGAPPPPPLPEAPAVPPAHQQYGEAIELPEPEAPPESPLIALGRAEPERVSVSIARAELFVSDASAIYRERGVSLTDPERAQIARVVLKAIKRSLDEQYQEVAGCLPRRSRKDAKPRKERGA